MPFNPSCLNHPATNLFSRRPRLPLLLLAGMMLAPGCPALLHAEGSPPLITEDPGTPGSGHWEVNLGISTERRPGRQQSELPLLDLNYGIGETVQLKFDVPYLVQSEAGHSRVSGLGNSGFGIKWRFHDRAEDGLALSIYPQVESNNPGSSSDERGLVEPGAAWALPVQLERTCGLVTLNLQFGREFRSTGDTWFYGAAFSHRIHDKCEMAVEFVGEAKADFGRSQLTVNFGFAVDVAEHFSLMVSAGRELHNHDEPRATLIGYVGWQLRL